jgi:HK97 family phage prohead protease
MIERRFVKGAEIRADGDGHIVGHAAVFDEEYVLWDGDTYRVVETVKPGAFTRALKDKDDVRCLFNHDPNQVLGRSTSGTMKLKQDDVGLYFDCTPPDTQLGRDVVALIKRGDISGCSFAFVVSKETITEEKVNGKTIRTREIEEVDPLLDASPVTYPAYTGTDVNARAIEMRAQMFPQGVPAKVLALVPQLRDSDSQEEACRCRCRACYSGECDECDMNMQTCGDESYCDHSMARAARSFSSSTQRDGKPTKRVDGEDLAAGCFIYVGDPDKPETWALPWKFKSEAKIKSHLRNALARFNQTEKIPADSKAAAWKKLVRLAKKYGITVSDQEAKSWGLTAEQRVNVGSTSECQCDCAECQTGDCDNCSNPDCEGKDEGCDHSGADENDDADRSAAIAEVNARLRRAGMSAV